MAIARKIDPAALARSFADEISAVPEVKRVWYWFGPGLQNPDQMYLDFYVLLDPDTNAAHTRIANALTCLQEQHFDDIGMSMETFLPWHVETRGLENILLDGSIEVPLRGG